MSRWSSFAYSWLLLFVVACAAAETSEIPDDGFGDGDDPGLDASAPDSSGKDAGDSGDASDADDFCKGITCSSPPANDCADENTARFYEKDGVCQNQRCEYPSTTVPCPFGCKAGVCQSNPCEGITCNQPPANTCLDATTLRVHEAVGTCGTEGCKYESELVPCPHGCAQGKCKDDPCVGVTCATPPENECASASYLTSYHSTGTCSNGSCVYASDNVHCKFGCENGVCNGDPCLGKACDTPPANHCQDDFKLVVYETPGTCSGNGVCSYTKRVEHCAFGCDYNTGKCKADPCLGISCNNPPADYCLEQNLLRRFVSTGTCAEGSCGYDHEDVECPCVDGVCKDCNVDDDCEDGKYCNDNSCTACRVDDRCGDSCTDCTANGEVCDATAGSCVACVSDGHCGSGSQCVGNACEACGSDQACGPSCSPCGGATPFCKGAGETATCVECLADEDCSGSATCNPATNTCNISPLCQAALTSATTSLANSGSWTHAKMDGVGTGWNYDFWQFGTISSGPGSCYEGSTCWATNRTGNYINCQRADLRTPTMNVTACADAELKLVFWHWYDFWTGVWDGTTRYDGGLVEISKDGGATWSAAPVTYSGTISINPRMTSSFRCNNENGFYVHNKPGYVGKNGAWERVEVTIPPEFRTDRFRVRFAYASGVSSQSTSQTPSSSRAAPGWYIDEVAIVAE